MTVSGPPDRLACGGPVRVRIRPRYERPARLFGVKPENAGVEVGDERFEAHFGHWRVRTPLTNIAAVEVTWAVRILEYGRPGASRRYRPRTRRSRPTATAACWCPFGSPCLGVEPTGLLKHPELTVTVADVEGLAALLLRQTASIVR